jgi:exodeoxyribonuclease VII large subunit
VAILDRGYALVFDRDGNLVTDTAQLARGDVVRARVARGEFTAEVVDSNPNKSS